MVPTAPKTVHTSIKVRSNILNGKGCELIFLPRKAIEGDIQIDVCRIQLKPNLIGGVVGIEFEYFP